MMSSGERKLWLIGRQHPVLETPFLQPVSTRETEHLPRQARDKQPETLKKRRFLRRGRRWPPTSLKVSSSV